MGEVRDLAWIAVDGVPVARLSRTDHDRAAVIPRGEVLTVLVEDQGRVNYAERIGEPKGLVGGIRLAGEPLTGWKARPVDLSAVAAGIAHAPAGSTVGRTGLRGSFTLDAPADLYLDTATLERASRC